LLSLYDGSDWHRNLTDLGVPDWGYLQHALIVIRGRMVLGTKRRGSDRRSSGNLALEKLRGSGRVTGSALTKRQRRALDEFARKTACVQETIAGRGTVYQVLNEKVLETHWRQLRPDERAELPEDLPQRTLNVALSRDGKGSDHSHGVYYLLLKGAGSGATWSNGHSTLNLSDATRDYGAATLGIRIKDDWTSDQTLWLVENQNLFDNLDWLPDGEVASVAYYGGQLRIYLSIGLRRHHVPEKSSSFLIMTVSD
jgi:hypothetical protein